MLTLHMNRRTFVSLRRIFLLLRPYTFFGSVWGERIISKTLTCWNCVLIFFRCKQQNFGTFCDTLEIRLMFPGITIHCTLSSCDNQVVVYVGSYHFIDRDISFIETFLYVNLLTRKKWLSLLFIRCPRRKQ